MFLYPHFEKVGVYWFTSVPLSFHPSLRPSVCHLKFFVKDFSTTILARVVISGIQIDDNMLYCGIVNQASALILPSICPVCFLSKLGIMKFFIKDFCQAMQARVVVFGMQIVSNMLYLGIANQPSAAYSSLYLIFFLSILQIMKVLSKISVTLCKLE